MCIKVTDMRPIQIQKIPDLKKKKKKKVSKLFVPPKLRNRLFLRQYVTLFKHNYITFQIIHNKKKRKTLTNCTFNKTQNTRAR